MQAPNQQTSRLSAMEIWRFVIQFGLIFSGAVLLLTRPYLVKSIRTHEMSADWLLVGPSIFLIFFLVDILFEFIAKKPRTITASDYIRGFFGVVVIALSFPSSLREYRVRQVPDPFHFQLIEEFSESKDARVRALAILASSRHKFDEPALGALIHKGLLDKDPLVQQAAKLIIEENFGIRLKNGAEGLHQAQTFINDVASSASLMKKGSP